jgi:hypothetical protein
MLTTWRALQLFAANADVYLAGRSNLESKIAYAINRVRDQTTKYAEQLQTQMLDVEIDLCVVDEKDVITRDTAGNLQFTREGLKERNRRQRELLDQTIEIDPFYVSAVPNDLTPAQLDAFTGFVIPPVEITGARNGGPPATEVPAMLAAHSTEAGA